MLNILTWRRLNIRVTLVSIVNIPHHAVGLDIVALATIHKNANKHKVFIKF